MIRKLAVLITLALFLPSDLLAGEEAVLSLFDDAIITEPTQKKTETSKESSLFSFLNFKVPFINHEEEEKKINTFDETFKAAEEGDVEAQLLLGYSYLFVLYFRFFHSTLC